MQIALLEAATLIGEQGVDLPSVQVAAELARQLGTGPAIRFDLAWVLLAPDGLGAEQADVPTGNPRTRMRLLMDWARQALGLRATAVQPSVAVVLVPPLAPAAAEWVRRTVSFYADIVGMGRLHPRETKTPEVCAEELVEEWGRFTSGQPSWWKEGWWPPVARPWEEEPSALLQRTVKNTRDGIFVFLGAILGSDRLAMQTYRLSPRGRGNRRHVHSDVDECYVVWQGSGELRLGSRSVPLAAGDLVAKPAGSGLALEFVAGPEGMTVLDIEAWRSFHQTDVVAYPDHQERYLRGPGLEVACPESCLLPATELLAHYEERYIRQVDGSRVQADPDSMV